MSTSTQPQTQTAAAGAGDAGAAQPQPDLIFGGDGTIIPDKTIIRDNETFAVQWSAFNRGPGDAPAFTDLLVITSIPEGCPGSDDQDHPVVFDSRNQGNPQDFLEQSLPAGQSGSLMQPMVGPLAAGSYRLTVTLGVDVSNLSNYNCIEVIASENANG